MDTDVDDETYNKFMDQLSESGGAGSGSPENQLEELLRAIEGMDGISDEDKVKLRSNLLMQALKAAGQVKPPVGSQSYLVFFIMISIIIALFGT